MDSTRLNDVLQILGMLGIMGSLIFVGMQLKQTDEIASVQLQDNAVQRHHDVLALMAEFADVWQRGCAGDELGAAERALFAKIFTVYRNNNFAGWRRLEASNYRDTKSDNNINAFAANVHRYPGFAAAYRSESAWDKTGVGGLGPTFDKYRGLISARIEELAKIDPNPDYGTEWCGRA